MTDIKPAPYPADTRAKGWRFELDYERFVLSDSWALAKGVQKGVLLMMAVVAWRESPCGSLPSDEELLRRKLNVSRDVFADGRTVFLREWPVHSDGRRYHWLVTEQALEMIQSRARGWLKHRAEVIERCGAKCWYCGRADLALALDHVFPRSRGGNDDPENLVPACQPCNSSKGARTPEEWRA